METLKTSTPLQSYAMGVIPFSLINVIGETDFLTKWLGVSIEAKLSGKFQIRRTVLVVMMHLGLLHALGVSFIPISNEETLLVYADIGFHMLDRFRSFL